MALIYVLQIGEVGAAAFALVGGASKKGTAYKPDIYDLFRDEPRLDDVDLVPNAFTVFRKVTEIVRSIFSVSDLGASVSTQPPPVKSRYTAGLPRVLLKTCMVIISLRHRRVLSRCTDSCARPLK